MKKKLQREECEVDETESGIALTRHSFRQCEASSTSAAFVHNFTATTVRCKEEKKKEKLS